MNKSRRTFLRHGAAALAGTSLLARGLFATPSPKNWWAVQLYSIQEDMKNDPLGTLKQLAGMGYKHVEHASYRERKFYGYAPKEFKKCSPTSA
jgi:hypothetical protein